MTNAKITAGEGESPRPQGVRDERLTPNDAYALMAELSVGFSTTAKELHLAGIEAQATKRLDPARAKAWGDLRNVQKRLALDLTFAQVGETELLPSSAIPLVFEPLAAPTVEMLAAELPAPVVPPAPNTNPDLPLPVVDVWQLAAEILEAEPPPPFVLPDPEPFIENTEEDAQ